MLMIVTIDVVVEIVMEEVVKMIVEMKNIILYLNYRFLVDSYLTVRHTVLAILLDYCSCENIYLFH